jgi:plastocyanin
MAARPVRQRATPWNIVVACRVHIVVSAPEVHKGLPRRYLVEQPNAFGSSAVQHPRNHPRVEKGEDMSKRRSHCVAAAAALTLVMPLAQARGMLPPNDVTVQFGQPTFPQDPAPLNHILVPDEVTIARGGTVTFELNGANHGIAIYPVSSMTTRADIEAGLCQPDPATCQPQGNATSSLQYLVMDAMGDVVVDTGVNPPETRVNDPTERLIYAGGPVFLTGRTAADAAPQQIQYRFEKLGRYLVICTDRPHFINDHMFGFVNVVRKYQRLPR